MSRSSTGGASFRTLYHGSAAGGGGYGLFLIRRSGVWARRWEAIMGRHPAPPPPLIDLARETVVVLAVGPRPTSGYDVTIEDVTVRGTTLVVTGVERRPVNCATLDMVYSPIHVVAARIRPDTFEDMVLNLHIKAQDVE